MASIIVSRTPAPLPALLLLLAVLAGPSTLTSAHLRAPRNSKLPVEAWLSTPELIAHWGYPAETHTVQTDDGFLIDVHRIPGPKPGDKPGDRPGDKPGYQFGDKPGDKPVVAPRRTPVLIAHGYSASSECMVLRPHDNLAFMLADAGFDVWLGNTRGNFYGKRHRTLSPQDKEFWDFGWHENGLLDMSATIDLILRETGEPSVAFVGHSMGCSSLFALLSDRPEYNAKVRAGFLLAPAVYFNNLQGAFLQIRRTPFLRAVHRSWLRLNMENPITRAPYPRLCLPPNSLVMNPSCMKLFTEAQGPFYNMANNTYMPILMRHWPAGSSVGQTTHFLQLIIQGDGFRKYDYGPEMNSVRYGSNRPPEYNLTNVNSPMFLFYSATDYQANGKDVKRLASDIPGTAGLIKTPTKIFNHLDIMYEEAAARLIYKRLIKQMTKYRSIY